MLSIFSIFARRFAAVASAGRKAARDHSTFSTSIFGLAINTHHGQQGIVERVYYQLWSVILT